MNFSCFVANFCGHFGNEMATEICIINLRIAHRRYTTVGFSYMLLIFRMTPL